MSLSTPSPSFISHMVVVDGHAVTVVLGVKSVKDIVVGLTNKERGAVAFASAKKSNIWVSSKVTPLVGEDTRKRAACEDQASSNSCR